MPSRHSVQRTPASARMTSLSPERHHQSGFAPTLRIPPPPDSVPRRQHRFSSRASGPSVTSSIATHQCKTDVTRSCLAIRGSNRIPCFPQIWPRNRNEIQYRIVSAERNKNHKERLLPTRQRTSVKTRATDQQSDSHAHLGM